MTGVGKSGAGDECKGGSREGGRSPWLIRSANGALSWQIQSDHGAVGSQECFRAFSVQTDLLTQLRELGGKGTHVFIRGFDGITHRTQ